jgi:membrane protease YdiL (CAAX protease family)
MSGIQLLFMIPGLFAPFIAAVIMIGTSKNKIQQNDFWNRLGLQKIKRSYLPAIFLIMPVTLLLATGISLLFGQPTSQFYLSKDFKIMDGQFFISLLVLFLAPTLEELGWRGYGVDSLRSKYTLFRATWVFAILWALWHLPLFFINGYYHHGLWETNFVFVINFFIAIFPASVLTNWIYYKNNRSITSAILFHFLLNLFSVLFQTEQFTKCIITILLVILSIAIILKEKDFFFNQNSGKTEQSMPIEPSVVGNLQ